MPTPPDVLPAAAGATTAARWPRPPQDDRVLVTVLGNCQAGSIRVLLQHAQPERVRSVRVPALHELTAADLPPLRQLLAATDVLVCQPVRPDYRDLPVGTAQLAALLPPHGRLVLVPVLRWAALHPLQVVVRSVDGEPPVVPYHDLSTMAEAAGHPLPPLRAAAVRAVRDESAGQLRSRERRHGTLVASDLFDAAGADATHTVNHPGNPVLRGLAARVLAALGWPDDAPDPGRTLLDAVHAPVRADVLAALGLDAPDRPDWVVDGATVPAEEVRAAQLAWYADHPRALADGLRRHADVLRLLGAA